MITDAGELVSRRSDDLLEAAVVLLHHGLLGFSAWSAGADYAAGTVDLLSDPHPPDRDVMETWRTSVISAAGLGAISLAGRDLDTAVFHLTQALEIMEPDELPDPTLRDDLLRLRIGADLASAHFERSHRPEAYAALQAALVIPEDPGLAAVDQMLRHALRLRLAAITAGLQGDDRRLDDFFTELQWIAAHAESLTSDALHQVRRAVEDVVQRIMRSNRLEDATRFIDRVAKVAARLARAGGALGGRLHAGALLLTSELHGAAGHELRSGVPAMEAVDILRRLTREDPATVRDELAIALVRQAVVLRFALKPRQALAAASEAVGLLRAQVPEHVLTAAPATLLALRVLRTCWYDSGEASRAFLVTTDAVQLAQWLVHVRPGGFETLWAKALQHQAENQIYLGDREGALLSLHDSVHYFRVAYADAPEVAAVDFAQTLDDLAGLLWITGRSSHVAPLQRERADVLAWISTQAYDGI